jgi:SSS family solute:Na+ symporter
MIIVSPGGGLLYATLGGIQAVVWPDSNQGIILIGGTVLCLVELLVNMPRGGLAGVGARVGGGQVQPGELSLSAWGCETFWVPAPLRRVHQPAPTGSTINVQRYLTARSHRDAVRSTLFGSLLYVPVSFLFFAIGTSMYAFYQAQPDLLPPAVAARPDQVLPYFIVQGLPVGVTGLLIASIFAAGMSTVATSLNSGATILLTDYYVRYVNPRASERQSMRVLHGGTVTLACGRRTAPWP